VIQGVSQAIFPSAWRDRLRYFGDPAKINFDWRRFISSGYAAERMAALKKSPRSVDYTIGPKIPPAPEQFTFRPRTRRVTWWP
jgi:hypothetical protein